jgi:hypothetical protein
MSEPTIKKVEKTQKPKDPKRVESGKRLAAISKEAKAKKAAERRSAESNSDQDGSVNALIYNGVATTTLGGIYYIYSKTKSAEKSDRTTEPQVQEESKGKPVDNPKPKFEKFNN